MKRILCYLLFFTFSTTVIYAQVTFTGQGDGYSWEDDQNWRKNGNTSLPGMPKPGDDILIDGDFHVSYYNFSGSSNSFGTLELRNGSNLDIQSNFNLAGDLKIDIQSSLDVSVTDVDVYVKMFCNGNYFINGTINIRFLGFVPQIGDSFKIVNGAPGSCGTPTTSLVFSDGFETTMGVECEFDGVNYTVTDLNYTTAISWDGEGGDGMWNNPANWDPYGVPPADAVVILNLPDGGDYVVTQGAGVLDVHTIYIGRNNTLELNGDLLMTKYIYLSNEGTLLWNAGKIYSKDPVEQSGMISYGNLVLDSPGLKELDTNFFISSFGGDIEHYQGDLNINNGVIRIFNNYSYNINGDNITIGYTSGTQHELTISGISSLKKTYGNGMSSINLSTFINYGKVISEAGTLAINEGLTTGKSLDFIGTYGGSGGFQFPSGFVMDGKLSPGSSPGILTVIGDLTTSSTATFNIEIDGPNAGTDYDQILVTNSAVLEGTIVIDLGYLPANNASFQILKANTLSSCNFPAKITTSYNGSPYTFDVVCQNNILYLNGPGFSLSNENKEMQDFAIYPNPVKDILNVKSSSISKGHWQLTNQIGQVVKEADYSSNEFKISLDNMASGLYFFKLQDADLNAGITRKIMISK